MVYQTGHDIYADERTGVLKNRLGISNRRELEVMAARISAGRQNELRSLRNDVIPSKYPVDSVEFLMDLHKLLLGEVYDWAGEYRKVDVGISYDHVAYEPWGNVPEKLEEVFAYIKENDMFRDKGGEYDEADRITGLALVYGNIKNLQPFRDGNTRTAMLYTQFLAGVSGYVVDFDMADKERLALASVAARDGKPDRLVIEFAFMTYHEKYNPEIGLPKIIHDPKAPELSKYISGKYRDASAGRNCRNDGICR